MDQEFIDQTVIEHFRQNIDHLDLADNQVFQLVVIKAVDNNILDLSRLAYRVAVSIETVLLWMRGEELSLATPDKRALLLSLFKEALAKKKKDK